MNVWLWKTGIDKVIKTAATDGQGYNVYKIVTCWKRIFMHEYPWFEIREVVICPEDNWINKYSDQAYACVHCEQTMQLQRQSFTYRSKEIEILEVYNTSGVTQRCIGERDSHRAIIFYNCNPVFPNPIVLDTYPCRSTRIVPKKQTSSGIGTVKRFPSKTHTHINTFVHNQ